MRKKKHCGIDNRVQILSDIEAARPFMAAVRQYLKDKNISHRQISETLGWSRAQIQQVLSGQRRATRFLLKDLSVYTGVSLDLIRKPTCA